MQARCPHCGKRWNVHRDVIFFGPCPKCSQWVIHFRDRVMAVDREVLESGTEDAKRQHLFGIFCHFVEPLLRKLSGSRGEFAGELEQNYPGEDGDEGEPLDLEDDEEERITQKEIDDFINIDLNLIDKKKYFDRIFGSTDQTAG